MFKHKLKAHLFSLDFLCCIFFWSQYLYINYLSQFLLCVSTISFILFCIIKKKNILSLFKLCYVIFYDLNYPSFILLLLSYSIIQLT